MILLKRLFFPSFIKIENVKVGLTWLKSTWLFDETFKLLSLFKNILFRHKIETWPFLAYLNI